MSSTPRTPSGSSAGMSGFSPVARTWFTDAFADPTPAQTGAWQAIAAGRNALVVAPTGSGKTLAAFLWALDRLSTTPPPEEKKQRCRVLYVSPLKALAVDVERNLRAPLAGHEADRRPARHRRSPTSRSASGPATPPPPIDDGSSTAPPDVMITTPESLFLMLTSQAREALRGVDTVILDEVHAVAGTKRGAHLALSLERLDEMLEQPGAADRPVRDRAPDRGGRPLPRRRPPGRGGRTRPRPRSGTSRSSSRSRT